MIVLGICFRVLVMYIHFMTDGNGQMNNLKQTHLHSRISRSLFFRLSSPSDKLTLKNAFMQLMQFHFLITIIKLTTIYNPFVLYCLLQRMLNQRTWSLTQWLNNATEGNNNERMKKKKWQHW